MTRRPCPHKAGAVLQGWAPTPSKPHPHASWAYSHPGAPRPDATESGHGSNPFPFPSPRSKPIPGRTKMRGVDPVRRPSSSRSGPAHSNVFLASPSAAPPRLTTGVGARMFLAHGTRAEQVKGLEASTRGRQLTPGRVARTDAPSCIAVDSRQGAHKGVCSKTLDSSDSN